MPEIEQLAKKKDADPAFEHREGFENPIPVSVAPSQVPYLAERGYRAMREIGEMAKKNGVSKMSLDEINAEIEASRRERSGAARGRIG